jgi:predicted GNAT family N-acyltransferase
VGVDGAGPFERPQAPGVPVAIRWVAGERDMQGALDLRERVFCGEQGVAREEEIDGRDGEGRHLVALAPDGEHVIGTLRLLLDGAVAKIGRVAVDREWRRRGIAARMLALALDAASEAGAREARLAAQTDAIALYAQAGFEIVSGEFEEAGIPHVWMSRSLVSGP